MNAFHRYVECLTCVGIGYSILQVLRYLLDDVSDFLSTQFVAIKEEKNVDENEKGCSSMLKAFIDYVLEREKENFHIRRHDNKNSVTLTTIHQVFSSSTSSCTCQRTSFGISYWDHQIYSAKLSIYLIFLSCAVKRLRMGHCFHSEGTWLCLFTSFVSHNL